METIHAKFSTAATSLTDLFKEATNAYESGYRDALLHVHRYLLLTASASAQTGQLLTTPSLPPTPAVSSRRLLHFIQVTLDQRRSRVANARGTTERRRSRECAETEHDPRPLSPSQPSLATSWGYAPAHSESTSEGSPEENGISLDDAVITRPPLGLTLSSGAAGSLPQGDDYVEYYGMPPLHRLRYQSPEE